MKKIAQWEIKTPVEVANRDQFPEVHPIVLQLLWDRGLRTEAQIEEFLTPDYLEDVHDPFLFSRMVEAVDLLSGKIKAKELVAIHGDYDADGVTASVILASTIRLLGGEALVYLPHRETEGYGLSKKAIDYLARKGAFLLITADCGISNREEVEYAKSSGFTVIVTDHHEVPAVPPECILIHPRAPGEEYPFKYLTGGGVAFKFMQAILRTKSEEFGVKKEEAFAFEKWLLDLVAISTVADMMPLLGENRTLVKYGLVVLAKSRRVGMKSLLERAGLLGGEKPAKLDADTIGFQIAPRINAAGRMDHANIAFELLMEESPVRAGELAEAINKNNADRKDVVTRMMESAYRQLGEVPLDARRVLSVYDSSWSLGVAGLVAGKLCQEFYLPSVVAADLDGKIAGSVRSIPGFNFVDMLWEMKGLFEKFGGHAAACGFTLKNRADWPIFQKKASEFFFLKSRDSDVIPKLMIDQEIPLREINWDLMGQLEQCEPFGKDNPRPVFISRGVTVKSLDPIGNLGKHLRLSVFDGQKTTRKCIGFCFGHWCQTLKSGDKIDMVYEVGVNEWNGNRELQLRIVDLKLGS
ncbi:MAG: single-stranded-DNA-specific exonuclease [Parcubacteria group bacterium Gr01-1014_18]|nr:MAG: single-stranded-DNA-specific exonuclease [Parcubacteria group bacterium Greene0416_36]TSC81089.1 MAG: single-stranded-DNA-specific exonuclease [Parcubacteria group bacterium Gr01-1014_18]TSC98495.1 MAG: single-stranded-DNA-specific exonuclease [Parcubacteria group bacterium Greene1014_20]TSD07340.1 MAG: single-stranded-DNA-specific exonuclease [Parcubacteria group bacterium Greene0714_2]